MVQSVPMIQQVYGVLCEVQAQTVIGIPSWLLVLQSNHLYEDNYNHNKRKQTQTSVELILQAKLQTLIETPSSNSAMIPPSFFYE